MPRPANGYVNAAGEKIPGVHDITGRYADKGGLINWAYSQGKKGVPLYEKGTLDIGTVIHHMAELDLRGASKRGIEAEPFQMLSAPGDIDKAVQAFRAFQAWRGVHDVRGVAFEEALVSEEFQYGGTFDCIAWVDGVRSLIDFKTCKTAGQVYLEQRVVMAAHGNLWHEAHPEMPLRAYHLINLPKDGSEHRHFAFADLSPEWEMFTLQLDCWRIEKGLSRKRSAQHSIPLNENVKVEIPVDSLSTPKRTRKPKAVASAPQPPRLPPPPMRDLSLAEMLRHYGHVKEAA